MIPSGSDLLSQSLDAQAQPSKNYKMHFEKEMVHGHWDELEAMKQVVFKILNTERYQYLIYSWNYGIELEDLFGEPISYVCPELQRRITEALLQDERVDSVDSFSFDLSVRRVVQVRFVVHSIFGDVSSEKVVNI